MVAVTILELLTLAVLAHQVKDMLVVLVIKMALTPVVVVAEQVR